MRRKLALLAVGVATAALSVATASAGPPEFDKAEGAGTYGPGCAILVPPELQGCFSFARNFSFSAIQRGFGESASGVYTNERLDNERRFTGRVTCLNVLGETAVFGGVIREGVNLTTGQDISGLPFAVWVIDNGNASDGDPPDLISPVFLVLPEEGKPLGAAFPMVCPEPVSPIGYFPLTSGNIVVEDESLAAGLSSKGRRQP
jgi:hypothetical protein